VTKQRLTCVPCPRVSPDRARVTYRQPLILTMSNLFGKAKQKFKKRTGRAADLLQPSPQESRAASPASSQQIAHPTSHAPREDQQKTTLTTTAALAQSSNAPISATIKPLQPSNLATPSAPSPPPGLTLTVPAYARPPSPPTILATTGSAVKGLLAAARDGSDLFLPLKAALVGVIALWDIFDVS